MKAKFTITVDNTKQVLGGYLYTTEELTDKQMIAHVRKEIREFMVNNKGIEKYGVWAEEDGNDDHSYHIEARRHFQGYIDFTVYDAVKNEIIVDTYADRLERERQKWEEDRRKFEEMLNSL